MYAKATQMKQPKQTAQVRQQPTGEDTAADPSLWTLLLLDITSTAVACSVVAAAVWAFCLTPSIPGPLPGALQASTALLAICVPIFVFRGFLRILPAGAAPYFFVRRHLPERLERDHAIALSGLTLVAVVAILAPNWRTIEASKPAAPFTRAATARSAQPTPITASPALLTPIAVVRAPESRVRPLLHHLHRLHLAAKPAPRRRRHR